MVDRINLILKAKNLTSRQFAEEIGIQPSGMSHILSGRNRPSLDFVMKVVNRYPEIDIKWLTLGEGEMYVSPYSMPVAPAAPTTQQTVPHPQVVPHMQSSPQPQTQAVPQPQVDPQPQVATEAQAGANFTMPETKPSAAPYVAEPDLFSTAEMVEDLQTKEAVASDAVENIVPTAMPIVEQPQTPKEVAFPMATPEREVKRDENRVNEKPSTSGVENRNLKRKRIVKVVILYDDHSFSEYYPE